MTSHVGYSHLPAHRRGFRPLLTIVGPTAVGKSSLAMELARRFRGEIVSADSRLLYRGMDIGTDKPDVADRAKVPHHLIDVCEPDQTLTLGQFQKLAYEVADDILSRDRLPILVGGTGQYIMAVVEGWGIPAVAPHEALRRHLEALGGNEAGRWLRMLDPVAARRIDARNLRRVIRALEVTLVTGRPISQLQRKSPPPYQIKIVGLTQDRNRLYQDIDARVDRMMEDGLIEEVGRLRQAGYGAELPSMSGLGYRQLLDYLNGICGLDESIQRIKTETHRYVRQQNTWFSTADSRIEWFSTTDPRWRDELIASITRWLSWPEGSSNHGRTAPVRT